jgi:hypothetical protein
MLGWLDAGQQLTGMPMFFGGSCIPDTDTGMTLLFIFFWVRSLNSGGLEYLQTSSACFLG